MGASSPQKVRHIMGTRPLAYTANGQDSVQIPGGFLLREMVLTLSFTMTSSANLAAAAILPGAEWGLINVVQILAGTEVIKEFTGEELRILNMFWDGRPPRPRLTLGATSTAVVSVLRIPFWDTLLRKPMDTALNTSAYGNLRMVVKWNDATKVASTGTVFSVAPQLDWSMETSTGAGKELTLLETRMARQIVVPPTGAQTDFAIPLQTGLVAIRSLLIYAKDGSGLDLPNKFTTLRIKSLQTLLHEGLFAAFRDQALHRLQLTEQVASSAKVSVMQETSFDMDNWLYFDFCKDGYVTEAFPTFRISDLRLLLTTTATVNSIGVLATFVIPPTNAQVSSAA